MRRLLRISAWILGIPFTLLVLAVGLVYLFSGQIKQTVVEEVNQYLSAKVQVGDIYFSAFNHFPQMSIEFRQVRIEESTPINDSALAVIENISLTLNLWDAIRQKIHIQALEISDGYISLAVNDKGEQNFDILKKTDHDSTNAEASLSFKKVKIKRVQVSYKQQDDAYLFQLPELSCSGDFKSTIFTTHLEGEVLAALERKGTEGFKQRSFSLNSDLLVDKPAEKVKFSKTYLGLESLAFELDGNWGFGSLEGGEINIRTRDAHIKKLLSLLPGEVKSKIEDYESTGVLQLSGSIRQKANKPVEIRAKFSVDDGSLFLKSFSEGLSNLRLEGDFLYTEAAQSLHISTFEARLMQDIIKGTLQITNFEDPDLSVFILSDFNLENIKRVANLGAYNESSGKIRIDVSLKAKLSELRDQKKYRTVFLNGKIKGEHLNLGNDSLENRLSDVNTFLEFRESNCSIHRLDANWNQQRIQVRGEAKNYLAYLFNEEELFILGRLKADKLDFKNPRSKEHSVSQDSVGFELPPRIRLEAEVELGELILENFQASSIRGRAILSSDRLDIKKLHFSSCGGEVALSGNWSKRPNGDQPVVINAVIKKVNIQELFREFNSFGQKEITEKNIRGLLSGEIDAGFLLDRNFNFRSPSLYAFIDISIDEGELNEFEPLKALSRFVRVEDLKNVRFKSLVNQFEIRDEIIFIPSMEIKNSALNLFVEGKHSFANLMDYSMKLQLKDVLARPYIRDHQENEFEKEEEGINIFIRMSGTPDKLSIRYDTKKARKNLQQEMKKEKQTVKEILRDEFGLKKKGTEKEGSEELIPNWEEDIPE